MTVIGRRSRNQPPPTFAVYEALMTPDRDPARPWLTLLDDEVRPRILESDPLRLVVWSSLWTKRPDITIRFELTAASNGTDLLLTMHADDPVPNDALIGHLRYRISLLINGNLRSTFGQ